MDKSVQTGLSDEFALEEVIPFRHGQLAGEYESLAAVSVIDYLFKVSLEFPVKFLHSEVVYYEEIMAGYLSEEAGLPAFKPGESEVLHQHVHCEVYRLLPLPAGPVSEGAREVGFPGSRRSCDEHGHSVVDIFSGSKFADLRGREASGRIRLEMLDGCLLTHMGIVQEPPDPAFVAVVTLGLQHEFEPVPQGQPVQLVSLIEGLPALCHPRELEFM